MAVALQEGGGERERERVGERERERETYHPYICAEASMRRHTTGGTFLGGGGREDDAFGMNRQELENDCEGDNEGSRRPPRGSSTVGSCASPEPDDAYNVCGFAQMEAGAVSSPHQDLACAARLSPPQPFQQTKKTSHLKPRMLTDTATHVLGRGAVHISCLPVVASYCLRTVSQTLRSACDLYSA
jgi:hypothetical protein